MTDPIIARAFACSDATEQAKMIDQLGRELYVACKGRAGYEMQLAFLSDKLSKDGQAFIEDLAAFVALRKKDIAQ